MDLKSVLSGKETLEFYWALVIEPGWVQAGVWNTNAGKANLISVGPSAAWEEDAELTTACDTALSAAVQTLPEDAGEPTKTVFGVSSAWVSDGRIKPEYLEKIKSICSALSLTPVGFVILGEAISYYFKSEEGSPLNAVLIGVGDQAIELSLYRLGNLSGTKSISRSVSIADDVAEGLSRFTTTEPFPSRILIYNGKENQLEEVKDALTKASWDDYEKVKFLHTPKIEIVTPENKILATALAGAAEIANATSIEKLQEEKDEEITLDEELDKEEVANVQSQNAEDLGFVVNRDIKEEGEIKKPLDSPPMEKASESKSEIPFQGQFEHKAKFGFLPRIKNRLATFLINSKSRLDSALEKFGTSKTYVGGRSGKPFIGKKIIVIGVVSFLLLFVGGFIFWWYAPTATVTIFVSPQRLEQTQTIYVDPSLTSINQGDRILPGEFVSQKTDGDKTKSTTGTKVVGENAKGEVTIYRSGSEITLASGTELTSSGGLEFTLDGSVTIASGSASTPGTAKAAVMAVDIGTQYNLAADESFSISNYPKSELEGKNESAFSGGTSREISAVSQDDEDSLEEELVSELKDKLTQSIEANLNSDEVFIEESVTSTILDETFSNKVGDEASTLKLSLTLEVKGLVVKKGDIITLAQSALEDKISQGYVLREDQIKTSFDYVGEENNIYELDANFSANLLPQIDSDALKKEIAGKYPDIANNYLSSIEGFDKVEIRVKPNFPGRLKTLPRIVKNITIEIAAD